MKIPFTIYDLRSTRGRRTARHSFGLNRQSPIANRKSDGIALVITLVLLSVITFMTVAFLFLSRRERGAVSTVTDSTTAKLAADTAMERAKAELMAPILAMTNDQQFDILVSTNYINRNGFYSGVSGYTNVNYAYANGNPLSGNDVFINLTNLYYNPRPPVYVTTNSAFAKDFRYYLDLNRNGFDDPNGLWPVISPDPANPYYTTNNAGALITVPASYNGWILSNNFVGDPEWIGVLEFPDRPHGPNNRFVSRYAYIVQPIEKTLDANYIHNQSVTRTVNPPSNLSDGYMRNQGVGTWEINLAAFLADLNTNLWFTNTVMNFNPGAYQYLWPTGFPNQGTAFDDARAIVSYRYNFNYATLSPASWLFPNSGLTFAGDNIDQYSDDPRMLMTGTAVPIDYNVPSRYWPGADNTNHYFTAQDFFDKNKTANGVPPNTFVDRLNIASAQADSYDRYTYYRMLAQLGTDSEPDTRINVNYKNVNNGVVVPGMETNQLQWGPLEFFTNAAHAMFQQLNFRDTNGNLVTVTNIPLYPVNYYSASVHRILQLAANIFDATTNQTVPLVAGQTNAFFPSVFRPIFRSQNGAVSIAGFEEVTNTTPLTYPYLEMRNFALANQLNAGVNLFGVPWVIGAKKGFPNFNEFAMNTGVIFGRKLRLRKNSIGGSIVEVKQLYQVGISNQFGIEAWNSYAAQYPRNLTLIESNEVSIGITNQFGVNLIPTTWLKTYDFASNTAVPANTWVGYNASFPRVTNFRTFTNGYVFFTNATYLEGPPALFGTNSSIFTSDATNAMPELYVMITNRLHYAVIDTTVVPNRVVDFVNIEGTVGPFDVSAFVRHSTACGNPGADRYAYWCTNQVLPPQTAYVPGIALNSGVNFQVGVSEGVPALSISQWQAAGADPNNMNQVTAFRNFLNNNPGNTNVMMQTPFNPSETAYIHTSWQANDPLVHYTVPDLADATLNTVDTDPGNPPLKNISQVNSRYRPWGGNPSNQDPSTDHNLMLKDPVAINPGKVRGSSDDWDFPTNKLPNIGWLGRIHRGTPWQTIYAKSVSGDSTNLNAWLKWSGHTNLWSSGPDAQFTMPVKDYQLFDLFTATPNANASRGRLGVNQTNLAAWSAVLSGVVVLTNFPPSTNIGWTTISPAGVYDPANPSPLVQIWTNINAVRANLNISNGTVFAGQSFHSVGDVLAAPALTSQSPFLTNAMPSVTSGGNNGINDEVLERIPQQIMALLSLSHTPRFVVYSFGQTLHPADHSLVTGGQFNGLCTNYQITAETATRAVVRAEPYSVTNGNTISTNYNLVVEQYNVLPPD